MKFLAFALILSSSICQAQKKTNTANGELPPAQLIKLVPDKVKGFYQHEDSKSSQISIGTLTYSLCEKNFKDDNRSIKILLFDFKNAPIMYNQAMRKWNNTPIIESDSIILRSVFLINCSGWESYQRDYNRSQIFLGICDRFFLDITGEKVKLEVLKEIVADIPLDKFPK